MPYKGTIELISGLKQANDRDFALAETHHIWAAEPDKRLDEVLSEIITDNAGRMVFKGTIGVDATVSTLPATHTEAWTYVVISSGTYAGKACDIGNMIICISNGSVAADEDWAVIQTNVNGTIVGPSSSVNDHIITFDGTSGKAIKDSGVAISDKLNVVDTITNAQIDSLFV